MKNQRINISAQMAQEPTQPQQQFPDIETELTTGNQEDLPSEKPSAMETYPQIKADMFNGNEIQNFFFTGAGKGSFTALLAQQHLNLRPEPPLSGRSSPPRVSTIQEANISDNQMSPASQESTNSDPFGIMPLLELTPNSLAAKRSEIYVPFDPVANSALRLREHSRRISGTTVEIVVATGDNTILSPSRSEAILDLAMELGVSPRTPRADLLSRLDLMHERDQLQLESGEKRTVSPRK